MSKLSEILYIARIDRPDEWSMDNFSRMASTLEKRIVELEQEVEADNKTIAINYELMSEAAKKIAELEGVADNQIWPSRGDGWSDDYLIGYERATHDMARKLKGGDG